MGVCVDRPLVWGGVNNDENACSLMIEKPFQESGAPELPIFDRKFQPKILFDGIIITTDSSYDQIGNFCAHISHEEYGNFSFIINKRRFYLLESCDTYPVDNIEVSFFSGKKPKKMNAMLVVYPYNCCEIRNKEIYFKVTKISENRYHYYCGIINIKHMKKRKKYRKNDELPNPSLSPGHEKNRRDALFQARESDDFVKLVGKWIDDKGLTKKEAFRRVFEAAMAADGFIERPSDSTGMIEDCKHFRGPVRGNSATP